MQQLGVHEHCLGLGVCERHGLLACFVEVLRFCGCAVSDGRASGEDRCCSRGVGVWDCWAGACKLQAVDGSPFLHWCVPLLR